METSMNYNRMTTIFFISGIIVMAELYTAFTPYFCIRKRFWHFKCCCLSKWCDLFNYVFTKLSILWYNF